MGITLLLFMNRNRFQFHIKLNSQQVFTFRRGPPMDKIMQCGAITLICRPAVSLTE